MSAMTLSALINTHVGRQSKRASHFLPAIISLAFLSLCWGYALFILPNVLRATGRALLPDAYPSWNAARVVLQHGDPYSADVTAENQRFFYGELLSERGDPRDEERFAYPVQGAFLYIPVAFMPWPAALGILRIGAAALISLTVLLWMPSHTRREGLIAIAVTLSTYPAIHAILAAQPSTLAVALVALAAYLANRNCFIWSGVCLALSTFKPQVSISVALPLAIYCALDWRHRKPLAYSFGGIVAAILATNWLVLPNWLPEWLHTVKAYSRYAVHTPHELEFLPVLGILLLAAGCWQMRRNELMRSVAISITAFQLIIPFQIYNELLLISPVLWLLDRNVQAKMREDAHTLASGIPMFLVLGGVACTALSLPMALLSPRLAQITENLPTAAFILLPLALPLSWVAISCDEHRLQAHIMMDDAT